MALSPQDQKLLTLLRGNARLSTASLARALGLARSTVQSRLARLEADGVIAGYTVREGVGAAAPRVRAHIMVKLDPAKARRVELALEQMPGVRSLFSVSGPFDLIAIAVVDTTEDLDKLIDAIRDLDGIAETHSAILLSTKFER